MIGVNNLLHRDFRASYNALTSGYATRAGITSSTELGAVNTLGNVINGNANILAATSGGAVYLVSPTSQGAAAHNYMSSSFTLASGVAPTYSTNGFSFDGVTQYLRTGFIPSVNVTSTFLFTVIIHCRNNVSTTGLAIGAAVSTTQRYQTRPRGAGDVAAFTSYASANTFTPASTDGSGWFTFTINGNGVGSRNVIRNGSSLGGSSAAATGTLPNIELWLGGQNNAGALNLPMQLDVDTVVLCTTALSTSDSNTLVTALTAYNTALGR